MKNIAVILILSVLTFSTLSFKKILPEQNHSVSRIDKQKSALPKIQKAVAENWSVSGYGFLIFPAVSDLEEYITLLKTKTHAEAQTYLDTIEFSSLGATLYDEEYENEMVTEEQAIDYVLDVARIFQVQGVIIKPISESECEDVKWEFILAMIPANLDNSSHEDLVAGNYDENTMNKFATNPPEEGTDLVTFMGLTPTGHEETEANPCPTSPEGRRPFWGWGPLKCTDCDEWGYKNCTVSYHTFWINVHTDYHPHVPCSFQL